MNSSHLLIELKQILEQITVNLVVNTRDARLRGGEVVFKVHLPHSDDPVMTIEELPQETIAPRETILLVEDEEVVPGLARGILMQAGYNVLEASDSLDAIRLCCMHRGPINLLLTDVVMPEISGKEVAECSLDLRPTIRVLYMSGHTGEAIVQHDANVDFIQKPFTLVSLTRKVREVLDRTRV